MTVAICQDLSGVSFAGIKCDSSGQAVLHFSSYETCSSVNECGQAVVTQVRQHNLQKSCCVAVLPADSYQMIQIETTDLSDSEKRDAARWQIRDRIDYPPEEAVLDLFEVSPFGSERRPLTYVVSAQQKLLRERIEMIESGELSLNAIDIPEFALRNVCDLFKEDERGLAVLLLLERTGVLVIVREGVLYLVRWLSSGMDDLIPYADGDYELLTERLDSIILEIQRSFDYCESTFQLPMVSRLLVAQTQQDIPAVISYLNDYLSTRVEPFSFSGILTVPEGSEQLDLNRQLMAIGGALRRESS